MRLIGVTLRVDVWSERGERRDAIDQRWVELLAACGCQPVLLPNHLRVAQRLVEQLPLDGFVLTGGGDLTAYGGASPERDELEQWLLDYASARGTPLLGVCRGMQAIQHRWGVRLAPVEGHVATRHLVSAPDSTAFSGSAAASSSSASPIRRNSYHRYAARATAAELAVTAVAEDGVIEAVAHRGLPIRGIMWHPEREQPFMASDLRMIQLLFRGENEHEHDSW